SDPGSATVTIDIAPQPTQTYDSSQAFDPNSNYGQNNFVQVAVATTQARFTLAGRTKTGEHWQILINGVVVASVTATSDGQALSTLIASLKSQLQGAGYTVVLGSDGVSLTVSTNHTFRAGFRILEDTSGTAAVTGTGSSATVAVGGTPAVGEIWTLSVDGTDYMHTFVSGDSPTSVATALAGLLPTGLYTAGGTGSTITISRKDGVNTSAALAISTMG